MPFPFQPVGIYFTKGGQLKGEATVVEYQEVIQEAQRKATEAMEIEKVPHEYRRYIRDYFKNLDPSSR